MIPEKKLELVHLQLTRNCNLRCWFCGQWGKKGFFSGKSGLEMTVSDWKKVIDDVYAASDKDDLPSFILWGGEPLVSPCFDEVAQYLHTLGFSIGIVTNGVLINNHIETCKNLIDRIYLSVDGPEKIHDSIRGEGVFKTLSKNLELIRGGKPEIIIMTVLSPALVECLEELPEAFETLCPDEVILQEMISLTADEAENYKHWMNGAFGIYAHEIDSWVGEMPENFADIKKEKIAKVIETKTSYRLVYRPHGEGAARDFCLSPFRHVHVAWNGNVLYCTDFYDFCAGNVKEHSITDIFLNEMSDKYRAEIMNGNCATCRHCSWKNNETFKF